MQLGDALRAWGTSSFETILQQELARQKGSLPLQQALKFGSSVADRPITVLLYGATESAGALCVRVGIFFEGVTGGCNCADDPTPLDVIREQCKLQLDIDKLTAATSITLLD
jgi:hypothetical protein